MDDRYKRVNRLTGEPFHAGYQDEDGRIFLRYLSKQGNDGYYLEVMTSEPDSIVPEAINILPIAIALSMPAHLRYFMMPHF